MREWNMICRGARARTPKSVRGVSLIEVLVTVAVLSIGLLGLAGLQANGTKFNHSAYLRSQATIMAYDIADRMRANRAAALAGTYNIAIGAAAPAGASIPATDLQNWKAILAARFPVGDGRVQSLPNNVFEIEVRWDDGRLVNAGTDSIVVRVRI